jgi:hypothetical protein
MAQRAERWGTVRGIDGQPRPPASGRAAGQKAATEELPAHDETPTRIAPAVDPTTIRRLTSCHSPKSLKALKSVDTICGHYTQEKLERASA